MDNLWGDFSIEDIETPKSILETQGNFLPKLTKRKVYASVDEIKKIEGYLRDFNYALYITTDYLNNYSFEVLSVHHNVDMYPLYIVVDEGILNDIEQKISDIGIKKGQSVKLVDALAISVDMTGGILGGSRNKVNLQKECPEDSIIVNSKEEFVSVLELVLQSNKVRTVISSLVSLSKKDVNF